ncbi:hypothetical protein HDV05_003296, partial [Chytridiales sp. JEL 0842]
MPTLILPRAPPDTNDNGGDTQLHSVGYWNCDWRISIQCIKLESNPGFILNNTSTVPSLYNLNPTSAADGLAATPPLNLDPSPYNPATLWIARVALGFHILGLLLGLLLAVYRYCFQAHTLFERKEFVDSTPQMIQALLISYHRGSIAPVRSTLERGENERGWLRGVKRVLDFFRKHRIKPVDLLICNGITYFIHRTVYLCLLLAETIPSPIIREWFEDVSWHFG